MSTNSKGIIKKKNVKISVAKKLVFKSNNAFIMLIKNISIKIYRNLNYPVTLLLKKGGGCYLSREPLAYNLLMFCILYSDRHCMVW